MVAEAAQGQRRGPRGGPLSFPFWERKSEEAQLSRGDSVGISNTVGAEMREASSFLVKSSRCLGSRAIALLLGLLLPLWTCAQPGWGEVAHRTQTMRKGALPGRPLTLDEQAAQVLNRFTFGPRPGEVAEVAKLGWETWFEQQLNPGSIPDPALDKRLADFPALKLAPQQLAIQYPDGAVIRRIADGKAAMPADPQLAGVYEVLLARYQRKQAEDKAAAAPQAGLPAQNPVASAPSAQPSQSAVVPTQSPVPGAAAPEVGPPTDAQKEARKQQDRAEARMLADQVLGNPKNQRMQAIFKLPVEQRMVLTASIAEPEKSLLTNEMTPHERELFGMMAGGYGGSGVIANEMQQAKIVRVVLSERQLQEVMTDFWINHFNIDLGKSGDILNYAPSYERDAIRAHALGKFRDLLLATAEHPAMLIYLDNWLSIGPDSQAAGKPKPGAKAQPKGLNENYGREVMELHTVGVDGGYTQADVTSLAEIMTGWTVQQPNFGGPFTFEPRRHEPGDKTWFGQRIPAGGMNEGVAALTFLAAQPQTAHFLSFELAQRFVADAPPPALVNRMAAAYMSSDGDISTVLRTMVHSPEFFSRANYRNKVKMPLEYVASSLRATDTDPINAGALVNELKTMGEPLYRCLPPTGYAATADHWMNSSALVDRLNYALQLTSGRFGGMRFDAPKLLAAGLLSRPAEPPPALAAHSVALRAKGAAPSGQEEALLLMERLLVAGDVSEKTNAVIRQQLAETDAVSPTPSTQAGQPGSVIAVPELADPNAALDKLAAMILGSPEFQVH